MAWHINSISLLLSAPVSAARKKSRRRTFRRTDDKQSTDLTSANRSVGLGSPDQLPSVIVAYRHGTGSRPTAISTPQYTHDTDAVDVAGTPPSAGP
jgi:hypothetical protein